MSTNEVFARPFRKGISRQNASCFDFLLFSLNALSEKIHASIFTDICPAKHLSCPGQSWQSRSAQDTGFSAILHKAKARERGKKHRHGCPHVRGGTNFDLGERDSGMMWHDQTLGLLHPWSWNPLVPFGARHMRGIQFDYAWLQPTSGSKLPRCRRQSPHQPHWHQSSLACQLPGLGPHSSQWWEAPQPATMTHMTPQLMATYSNCKWNQLMPKVWVIVIPHLNALMKLLQRLIKNLKLLFLPSQNSMFQRQPQCLCGCFDVFEARWLLVMGHDLCFFVDVSRDWKVVSIPWWKANNLCCS